MHKKLILLLETATTSCSVALCAGGDVIAIKEVNERNVHASHITLFIEDVMKAAGKKYSDLDAVAVSKGPGSYTGLRIGVSTAKGLCYALDIPLISVGTLEAMASGILGQVEIGTSALLVPMIDARRMEVYTAIYRTDLTIIEPVNAKIVDSKSFEQFEDSDIILFGDGSSKFTELFAEMSNIRFVEFENSAAHLSPLADKKLNAGDIENMAYFEPFYLKDFLAGKPAKFPGT
ncbi:MAG: tRNA (adenosine(37)-N6)-threonylcarbamoyltransferase complex dimerization subunit type 1 TsaB [Daejeonella sp.]